MLLWFALACGPPVTPASLPVPEEVPARIDPVSTAPVMTLEVRAEEGAKPQTLIWLIPEEGEELLVAYGGSPALEAFAGEVRVEGQKVDPPSEQALGAQHFRVERLTAVSEEGLWKSLGPERQWTGRFELETGEEGTKMAGETELVFLADGARFYPLHTEMREGTVTITGRAAERSPFVASHGGTAIFVTAVEAAEE